MVSTRKGAAALFVMALCLLTGCADNSAGKASNGSGIGIADEDEYGEDLVFEDDEEVLIPNDDVGEIEFDYLDDVGEAEFDYLGGDGGGFEFEASEDGLVYDFSGSEVTTTLDGEQFVSELQENGQVIYSDEFCQIRYFGETNDDDGNLIYVLGYKKFHGGLIRFNKALFILGSVVDGRGLRFSAMNAFTDGYWCHSGAHGSEYYDNAADMWWKDNEFIYLCCPKNSALAGGGDSDYRLYADERPKLEKYDDSVYDSFSTSNLSIYGLEIQSATDGTETEPPRFDEASDSNTHKCEVDLSVPVIRVRFDHAKVDFWAHT